MTTLIADSTALEEWLGANGLINGDADLLSRG